MTDRRRVETASHPLNPVAEYPCWMCGKPATRLAFRHNAAQTVGDSSYGMIDRLWFECTDHFRIRLANKSHNMRAA